MSDEGMNKLAKVIGERIKSDRNANNSLVLDFGIIQNDYSLLTNTYPIPIPKADYLVLRQLTLGDTGDVISTTSEAGEHKHGGGSHSHTDGAHDHGNVVDTDEQQVIKDGSHTHDGGKHEHEGGGEHKHTVYIPEKMRWIKPGDRVLVAWVQHDAVVIDIIRPATDIG